MFSWLDFVRRHHIEFNETGAHTYKGNVYIACPFCSDGNATKKRLGLHLKSPRWGCWKNTKHAGHDPVRLIRALLGCSWERAEQEAKEKGGIRAPMDELRQRLVKMGKPGVTNAIAMALPEEFESAYGATTPPLSWHRAYLHKRGFHGDHADNLIDEYGLLAGTHGRWDRRIIIPLRLLNGTIIAWTGRSISKNVQLRYDTNGPTSRVLYNADKCIREGGKTLAIEEGPFDALKTDYFGKQHGLRAVALIGLGGANKTGLVTEVFERGGFERVVVLLDATALAQAMELRAALRHLPTTLGTLPDGTKDPGDLTHRQVRAIAARWVGPVPARTALGRAWNGHARSGTTRKG